MKKRSQLKTGLKKVSVTKKKSKKLKYGIIIAFVALIAILVALSLQQTPAEINSFEECIAAGYPAMESYPRQCAVPGVATFTEKLTDYYGSATAGVCSSNDECVMTGCNGEICQSQNEEGLSSICIEPDKPTPLELGYNCACVNAQCQWA